MMDITLYCDRCKQILTHICSEDFRMALERLKTFTLDGGLDPRIVEIMKESPYYEEGDEDKNFFTCILFSLIGKEDARTVIAMIENMARAAGIDPNTIFFRKGIEEALAKKGPGMDLEVSCSGMVEKCPECGVVGSYDIETSFPRAHRGVVKASVVCSSCGESFEIEVLDVGDDRDGSAD